jgi:uncharacterized protein
MMRIPWSRGLALVAGLWMGVSVASAEEGTDVQRERLPSPEEISKLPADGGGAFNRLIHQRSPYLLQHARNPVDWYPWGAEALERARREDKPVFLSVGYSSCHWCHVMEHESFEDQQVADLLNKHFVSIKVDREERPDLDEIYMTATQLMTGRGGWPNSLFLMPDGRPWFAGTYFPREDAGGRAGFKTILAQLANVWTNRRTDVEEQADKLSAAVREASSRWSSSPRELDPDAIAVLMEQAVSESRTSFDLKYGGFGTAPKFPPHSTLAFLLEAHRETPDAGVLSLVTGTLDAMILGGIHDHVGGGFHRYSTDERWLVPHFEKMLYDNAQLARVFADAFEASGHPEYRAAAQDVLEWVLREMTGPEGCFYSALDADSAGEEGRFYVWLRAEILDVLGEKDGPFFCEIYNIRAEGNYRDEATGLSTGLNIPHLSRPVPDADRERLRACREKLRSVRDKRVWPALDDKAICSWNALMIGGFARAGAALKEPRYVAAAERAANFVLGKMQREGILLRSYRSGTAAIPGFLEDYAFLVQALLELHTATGTARWREEAERLAGVMTRHFADEKGGFRSASPSHESLIAQTKDPFDQSVPSANGVAAQVLVELGRLTGKMKYLACARDTVSAFSSAMARAPSACGSLLKAAAMLRIEQLAHPFSVDGPVAIRVARVDTQPKRCRVELRIAIDPGWHINSNKPLEKHLSPTAIELGDGSSAKLKSVAYPEGKVIALPPVVEKMSVYEDTVDFSVQIEGDFSEAAVLPLIVRCQPCDDKACQAPQTHRLAIHIQAAAGGDKSSGSSERRP